MLQKNNKKEQIKDAWDRYIMAVDDADDVVQSYAEGYSITKTKISTKISKAKTALKTVENLLKKDRDDY